MNLSILKDRLYNALGKQVVGAQAPNTPFQKQDILPEGTSRQQGRQTLASRSNSQTKPQTYQSQANSTFNTVTTSTMNQFYNPNQYQYSTMNGGGQNFYNPVGTVQPNPQPTGPVSKGKALKQNK